MKAYLIATADKLKEVVPLMKWQKEKNRVAALARVWSATERKEPEKAKKLSARIEIGRSAQVFRVIGNEVSYLGTMNLPQARAFVADMEALQ